MSRRLVISALPGETRAAWLQDGRLDDLLVARDDRPAVADNLYLGRVRALDRALDAAFVDIGLARDGLLPLGEGPKGLSEGDALIVRVTREPAEDKGARLSAGGLDTGREVARAAARAAPPALLRAAADPIAAALAAAPPDEIVIDDANAFARAKAALAARPDLAARLRLDLDPVPLFEREGVEETLEALLAPEVALPSGVRLRIEPVQTLTAIDVDTARHGGRGGAGARALAVDLEAAAAIPRELRLRALSGLIVIDFLALGDAPARKRVTAALRDHLAGDPQPCRVQAMRPSGLLEMTRRRGRPPLHELLTEPCGIGGGGRVKNPATLAFEGLRAARRAAAAAPDKRVVLRAGPRVAAALRGPAARARAALEARAGRPLAVEVAAEADAIEIVLGSTP